jgi:isoquinoline 1-oxidoreductase alpha subunit
MRRYDPLGHRGGTVVSEISITLEINGKSQRVEAAVDTPLLWVLRDHLGLTGTKFGCGKALCGACTVHVDGVPARSCQILLSEAQGRRITTIEGVSGRVADAVQNAWDAEQVPQCGYCQSGQVMAAVALLASNPRPDDAAIERAHAGHLCRCGAYGRIRRAVHAAAAALEGGK